MILGDSDDDGCSMADIAWSVGLVLAVCAFAVLLGWLVEWAGGAPG